jgi:hypothetical protein
MGARLRKGLSEVDEILVMFEKALELTVKRIEELYINRYSRF